MENMQHMFDIHTSTLYTSCEQFGTCSDVLNGVALKKPKLEGANVETNVR